MKHEHRLTSKGQVTIPKDIRDALGLEPGAKVLFALEEDGRAVISKSETAPPERDWLRRVREAQRRFKAQDPMPGMDGLAFQNWIREKPEV